MRLHEIITEKAIPDSHYGYWVTDRGDILPVPFQEHVDVALKHGGFNSTAKARYYGWAQITYQGYGIFYLNSMRLNPKTAAGIRDLIRMAEQSGCHTFITERGKQTPDEIRRSLVASVRFWSQNAKERIAKGLPAIRPWGDDYDDDDDLYEDVMIDEIESLPDQHVNLSDFQPHFTDDPIWTDPNDAGITIRLYDGKTQRELGILRGDVLIALLVTEPFYIDPAVSQIKQTAVSPDERQKGFMRLLVSFYRDHFGRLCSDQAQSDDAKAMWKALIQQPMGLKIMVWHTDTGNVQPAKGVPETEIWNDEADVVLLVEDVDLHRYGNRHDANILTERARYVTQRRWDCTPHPLFP